MSTVISVRIPRRLREELERLGINYAEEVRRFLEERVREEKRKRLLRELEELRRRVGRVHSNLAAAMVREDKEERP